MMTDQYVLGVDSSTSATKVIAFGACGEALAETTNTYPLYNEYPTWVEQDAEDWWQAFVNGCRQIMSSPALQGKQPVGLGLTHQRITFVPVDRDMRPLRRAILWNDTRCAEEVEYAAKTIGKQAIFERTGYPPAQWTLYELLWLKNHEPEVYENSYKIFLVQDYLLYKLSGELVMNQGSAAMTGALDIERNGYWAGDIIRALGLREEHWIEKIVPSGSIVGHVTKEAALKTALPEGLAIVAAGGDQPCGILGAGVIETGELGINGGTSCTNELLSDTLPKREALDYHIENSPTGRYIVENCIPSGGSALINWYKKNFGASEILRAEREGKSVWDLIYQTAAEGPAGNRGMIVVPYFQGANGPYWNLEARGMMFGLHSDYGRSFLVRGLIEGLAYESRREAELMETGIESAIRQIKMYGGSAKSDLWNQIFADVFNKPVQVPDSNEATALGAAICAAVACGMHESFKEAVEAMVRIKKRYEPIPQHVNVYEKFYQEVYLELYERVRDLSRTVARINNEG
ncbi:MAG: hypothetical protein GY801_08060 [bacterium]|nr:hypothetical protein [bacterium]